MESAHSILLPDRIEVKNVKYDCSFLAATWCIFNVKMSVCYMESAAMGSFWYKRVVRERSEITHRVTQNNEAIPSLMRDNIKIDFQEMRWGMDCIDLATEVMNL